MLQGTLDPNAKYRAMQKMPGPEDPLSPGYDSRQKEKMVMEGGWGSGVPKKAYELGGNITDFAAKHGASPELAAGLGYGTNVATQAIPALMSSYRLAGEAAPALLEKPAKSLMQSALKPSVADLESGAANKAVQTMLEKGINPTRGGMEKATALARELNNKVEAAVAASDESVSAMEVGSRLRPLYEKFRMQVDPHADMRSISDAWKAFITSPAIREQAKLTEEFGPQMARAGDASIPVQLAHQLKKGTYAALGGKSYGELGSASTEAQKQLARGLRETVAEKVPAAVAPLKEEAALMNVKDVAARRALMDANKNPLSLGTSIASIARDPLAAAGMWANASTPVKAYLARLLYSGSNPQFLPPAAIVGQEVQGAQK